MPVRCLLRSSRGTGVGVREKEAICRGDICPFPPRHCRYGEVRTWICNLNPQIHTCVNMIAARRFSKDAMPTNLGLLRRYSVGRLAIEGFKF